MVLRSLSKVLNSKASTVVLLFLFVLAVGCKSDNDRAAFFFENFFSNNWDTCKAYLQEPVNRDFVRILNSRYKLKENYDFSVDSKALIFGLKNSKDRDTIFLQWNESTGKLILDSVSVMKLFNYEEDTRKKMSFYYLQKREDDDKVLQWITFGDTIQDEGFLGEMYFYTYRYDTEARLKRAIRKGYPKAVVLLSDWYYICGDRGGAIKMLEEAASNGNSEAMAGLGVMYATDDNESYYPIDSSFYWYKKAAIMNNPVGMHGLGSIYEEGLNKKVNLDSAYYWYRRSSDLGDAASSVEIAYFFLEGEYFKEDINSGLLWLKKAIEQDPEQGYLELGEIYEYGIGVEQDRKLALLYYSKADSVGSLVAHWKIRSVKAEINKTDELN